MIIREEEIENDYSFSQSMAIIYCNDNTMSVRHINGHKFSSKFQRRFNNNLEKIVRASNLFSTTFAMIESDTDPEINQRTNALYYIVQHCDESWSKSTNYGSFYNSKDFDLNHKPEGLLRISDHWNFCNDEKIHCQTDDETFKTGWAIGRYTNEKYKIIKKFY